MNIVCQKCKRVFKNNQWVIDVIPIEKVSYSICPQCLAEPSENKPTRGMVYQEHIREQEKKSR